MMAIMLLFDNSILSMMANALARLTNASSVVRKLIAALLKTREELRGSSRRDRRVRPIDAIRIRRIPQIFKIVTLFTLFRLFTLLHLLQFFAC